MWLLEVKRRWLGSDNRERTPDSVFAFSHHASFGLHTGDPSRIYSFPFNRSLIAFDSEHNAASCLRLDLRFESETPKVSEKVL